MELQEAIRQRRSIRKYQDKDVPEDVLTKILESGLWAPFAAQRWLIVIVRNNETKKAMLGDFFAQGRNLHILAAPVNIVICSDLREENMPTLAKRDHGKEDFKLIFSVQETAAMIQNMLLTAHEFGLGACWNGTFNDKRVATILKLPNGVRPMAIISLGYPAETPTPPKREKLEKIVSNERFGADYF